MLKRGSANFPHSLWTAALWSFCFDRSQRFPYRLRFADCPSSLPLPHLALNIHFDAVNCQVLYHVIKYKFSFGSKHQGFLCKISKTRIRLSMSISPLDQSSAIRLEASKPLSAHHLKPWFGFLYQTQICYYAHYLCFVNHLNFLAFATECEATSRS